MAGLAIRGYSLLAMPEGVDRQACAGMLSSCPARLDPSRPLDSPWRPRPGRERFGARFRQFGGFRAGNEKRLLGLLGNGRFRAKAWPGAFWSQILAIWKPPGRQVNTPSETIGKRPFSGQILAGSPLEPDFGNLGASGPAIKSAFWDHLENGPFPKPGWLCFESSNVGFGVAFMLGTEVKQRQSVMSFIPMTSNYCESFLWLQAI